MAESAGAASLITFPGPYVQASENDSAALVLMHEPGIELLGSVLQPAGSLFEDSVSRGLAVEASRALQTAFRELGVEVVTVTEVLRRAGQNNRAALEDLAFQCVAYRFDGDVDALTPAEFRVLSSAYRRQQLTMKSVEELVEIVLTRPQLNLTNSAVNTRLILRDVRLQPLTNLVFCRDQQIVTARGLVMGRLSAPQRRHEPIVTEFCFQQLGIPVIGRIPPTETLEGGDFLAVSEDLAMLGIGLRTTYGAALHLMENDLLGVRRFAVVRDEHDLAQERMHLDTVMNILGPGHVVLLDTLLPRRVDASETTPADAARIDVLTEGTPNAWAPSPIARYVDVWERIEPRRVRAAATAAATAASEEAGHCKAAANVSGVAAAAAATSAAMGDAATQSDEEDGCALCGAITTCLKCGTATSPITDLPERASARPSPAMPPGPRRWPEGFSRSAGDDEPGPCLHRVPGKPIELPRDDGTLPTPKPPRMRYALRRRHVELTAFLRQEGFLVVPVTDALQKAYCINFINTGHAADRGILTVHHALPDLVRREGFNGSIKYVELEGITRMYGAAHCCTQVFRKPVTWHRPSARDLM
eukprot:TRINITY_DN554_c0_g1_i1.p1 TRINITY_DN554_c0_g1~~TRINITY_DN554_c0_g1_i1.p1  ORF type:complete len:588 (-),score=53.65 TRINITY_DN554_c0_g1_i1:252-2015(-)